MVEPMLDDVTWKPHSGPTLIGVRTPMPIPPDWRADAECRAVVERARAGRRRTIVGRVVRWATSRTYGGGIWGVWVEDRTGILMGESRGTIWGGDPYPGRRVAEHGEP